MLLHFNRAVVNHFTPFIRDQGAESVGSMFRTAAVGGYMIAKLSRLCLVLLFVSAVGMSACAAATQADDVNDPLEPMNRVFFDFDMFVDRIMFKPLAQVYVAVVPDPGRHAVRHALDNMNEPIVFMNNLLQGEFMRAHTTAGRFLLNSLFGIGGMFDWATGAGLKAQTGDFGQTLYVWGFNSGPYLFLPILGPTNPRDAFGYGVDSMADPIGYAFWYAGGLRWAAWTRMGVDAVDQRSQQLDTLDQLQKSAIDFYAELRSLSRQHREIELHNGEPTPLPKLNSYLEEDLKADTHGAGPSAAQAKSN
jgi:phospholipid-binding lipoprotein MlaA